MGSLAFASLPPGELPPSIQLARCALEGVPIRIRPEPDADKVRLLQRDEIVAVLEELTGDKGPPGNPRWFRLQDGFAHSAMLQIAEWKTNPIEFFLPDDGCPMRVTVPYSQAYRQPDNRSEQAYRAYYNAIFWVAGLSIDSDGTAWYRIRDERFLIPYFLQAEHLCRILPDAAAPIRSDVPPAEKRIEVDLNLQIITAFEGATPVFRTTISGGHLLSDPKPGKGKSVTPIGSFRVFKKRPSKHMGDGKLTNSLDAFEFPGTPWVTYFQAEGYAFHGVYWHNDFGRPRSHGCINMRPEEALWIYRWTDPIVPLIEAPETLEGTQVQIFE